MSESFKIIGLAKEVESPENPGSFDSRVALLPDAVARLVTDDVQVFVERGAGERIGFKDEEYSARGARIQDTKDLYRGKDLIIKLKGPSIESIPLMDRGTTMFCMFHLGSFPERTEKLKAKGINIIAMDSVVDSPRAFDHDIVKSKVAIGTIFAPFEKDGSIKDLDIRFLGWHHRLSGAIRRAGNRNTRSLTILRAKTPIESISVVGPQSLYVYDTASFSYSASLLAHLKDSGCHLIDIKEFEDTKGPPLYRNWYDEHPPWKFGFRKIEFLQGTGQAGARYGFKLLREVTKKDLKGKRPIAVILGYGNVGMGAIQECHEQGAGEIAILTRASTSQGKIESWLRKADIIVNAAVLPKEDMGKRFLITKKHVAEDIAPDTVLIDLVGGSPVTRGAIENILDNTFLDDPYFIENKVAFSALWGWPMIGMARESNERYSRQITEILLGDERLIDGLGRLTPGVRKALVLGPYAA